MNVNAISIANHFVGLSERDNMELRQFGLMKRVYITHGFCLAIFNRSALDPRFDVVEAWKNGPVIPSVYHSFKHNGCDPITKKSIIVEMKDGKFDISTPTLEDKEVMSVIDAVWKRYEGYDDYKLIELLHRNGTPWSLCYEEGKNNPIPDSYTKYFYAKLIKYVQNQRNT